MQLLAWLHTKPEGSPVRTRYQLQKSDSPYLSLPEVGGEYIIDLLLDVGPGMAGHLGMVPISATELRAWSQGTATELEPWEFSTLLDLSAVFVSSARVYEGSSEMAPDLSTYERSMEIKNSMGNRVDREVD